MSNRFELAKECPELWQGQAAGRPAWQMGLREDLLRQLDLVADEARRSDEALERYIGMTAPYRRQPKA